MKRRLPMAAVRSDRCMPKPTGILEGYLEVDADLPFELAQGLFATPGRYPVVMRFSTVPGDILDDSVSTPRGLSVKIIGVKGERLSGSEGDVTQDFLLVNGPAFGAPIRRNSCRLSRWWREPPTGRRDSRKRCPRSCVRCSAPSSL